MNNEKLLKKLEKLLKEGQKETEEEILTEEKKKSAEKIFEKFMETTHKVKEMLEKEEKTQEIKINTKNKEVIEGYIEVIHPKNKANGNPYTKIEIIFPIEGAKRKFNMKASDRHVSIFDFEDEPEAKALAFAQISELTKGKEPDFGRTGKRAILALLKFVTKVEKGFLKNKKQQEAN